MKITAVSAYLFPNPYFNQTLRSKFSKTIRQKFDMYTHFYRIDILQSDYNFTFNFCRVVIEKFGLKVRLRYGAGTSSLKSLETKAVQLLATFEFVYCCNCICNLPLAILEEK